MWHYDCAAVTRGSAIVGHFDSGTVSGELGARQLAVGTGVYILVQKQYLFPPPPSENDIFPPLATHRFLTPIVAFLPYFFLFLQLFYPFTSPFLIFFTLSSFSPLSSFFFPLSSFFLYIFPLFLFTFSYFFPQMTSADIFSFPQGGIFKNIGP
jgi:hypothetical protein